MLSLTLLALDQHGAAFQCIAPDADQFHVVNHATGAVLDEPHASWTVRIERTWAERYRAG